MPKNSIYTLLFFLLLSNFPKLLCAQEDTAATAIISELDKDFTEEELGVLTERLSFYKNHPLDLNNCTAEQLKELGFLSAIQISNFVLHRSQSGRIKDVLELQAVPGLDLRTISLLLPFVTVSPEKILQQLSWKRLKQQGEHQLNLRLGQTLEKQKGYQKLAGSQYMGSPQKLLLRYQYRLADRFSVNLTAEKDAGETFFRSPNRYGFDFYAGSIGLYNNGRFRKIIIGDYGLQAGQGLSLWTGASFGRAADVAGVAKNGTGLKPYTSANEAAFFRGLATEIAYLPNISFTPFISYRGLDASLIKLREGAYGQSAINDSGLHRTTTEAGHKNNLQQLVYGLLANYNTEPFSLGISAYQTRFAHPFIRGKQLYRQYSFEGKQLSNLGLSYNYTFKNLYLFGEVAASFPGGFASLTGLMASLSPKLSALVLFRDYTKDYTSFYTQALSDGSDAANEKGGYAGLHYSPSKQWDFSLYADLFQHPYPVYRTDLPSGGYSLLLNSSFSPSKRTRFLLRMSTKKSAQNDTSGLPINPVVNVWKCTIRTAAQWSIYRSLKLENRLELSAYKKGTRLHEFGYLVYQDVAYQPPSSRIAINIRMAWFSTSSYNSRIYAFEDDVQGGSGSALYNGRGVRTYINCSYRISKSIKIWCRYAGSLYPGVNTIGSGLDEISGNKKQDIRLLVRYNF
jgi:hypothetical protein